MLFAISCLCVGCPFSFCFIQFFSPAMCAHNLQSQSLHNIYYATLRVGGNGGGSDYCESPSLTVRNIENKRNGKRAVNSKAFGHCFPQFRKKKVAYRANLESVDSGQDILTGVSWR